MLPAEFRQRWLKAAKAFPFTGHTEVAPDGNVYFAFLGTGEDLQGSIVGFSESRNRPWGTYDPLTRELVCAFVPDSTGRYAAAILRETGTAYFSNYENDTPDTFIPAPLWEFLEADK